VLIINDPRHSVCARSNRLRIPADRPFSVHRLVQSAQVRNLREALLDHRDLGVRSFRGAATSELLAKEAHPRVQELPLPQVFERLHVREGPGAAHKVRVRPEAEVQVPLLRLPQQVGEQRLQARADEARGCGSLLRHEPVKPTSTSTPVFVLLAKIEVGLRRAASLDLESFYM
jgi:hypothetical protein